GTETATPGGGANAAPGQEQGGVSELKKMSLQDLMGVEVTTVSRQESTVGQSPAAVFVITPGDIRRSGATTIPELFRMVPGMDVARIDNNKWSIGARGFNDRFANKLLVQIDGRTLYNPLFAGVYWDAVNYPLDDIERIEIVRGPGASVWGANAVNGVINIITKSAKDTEGGQLTGAGGNELGFATARYGGKSGKDLYYRGFVEGFGQGNQFSAEQDPNDHWWLANSGTRFDWTKDKFNSLLFEGGYLRSVAGQSNLRPLLT